MKRDGYNGDSLVSVEEQEGADCFWPIVMQQIVVPVALHQFWNEHGDVALRLRGLLLHGVIYERLVASILAPAKRTRSKAA